MHKGINKEFVCQRRKKERDETALLSNKLEGKEAIVKGELVRMKAVKKQIERER